jgi:hypothetical protein
MSVLNTYCESTMRRLIYLSKYVLLVIFDHMYNDLKSQATGEKKIMMCGCMTRKTEIEYKFVDI